VIKILRSFYAPILKTYRNPIQFFIGHLRYAVHTLSFDESSLLQKIWAWYTAGLCARNITSYYLKNVTLRIDWLPLEYTAPGKIGLTILPGRKDRNRDLKCDIEVLKNNQITDAVVLVTNDEIQQYGVLDICSMYTSAGIRVYHLPILDQMVCSHEEMSALVTWMNDRLSNNAGIIIHCLGGLGRSGTVAGCLLKNRGLSAQDAINVVRKVRTGRAIESSIQEAMVISF
jgi:protein-tyrosine phosphatase